LALAGLVQNISRHSQTRLRYRSERLLLLLHWSIPLHLRLDGGILSGFRQDHLIDGCVLSTFAIFPLMRTGDRQLLPGTSLLLFFALAHLTKVTVGNITWVSPVHGDIYGPGETIAAEWRTPQMVVSPTFRLCLSNSINEGISAREIEGGCGSYMSPAVAKSAVSYVILLSV
jgi:hypothetical protein